jgi:hypothetical protein
MINFGKNTKDILEGIWINPKKQRIKKTIKPVAQEEMNLIVISILQTLT